MFEKRNKKKQSVAILGASQSVKAATVARLDYELLASVTGGSGVIGSSNRVICPKCHGTGSYKTYLSNSFGGRYILEICSTCGGTGKIPVTLST